MDKNKRTYIIITVLVVTALYFLAGDYLNGRNINDAISGEDNGVKVGINVGDMAPNFTLQDLNGNTVSLEDYKGKVVMLNFWSVN